MKIYVCDKCGKTHRILTGIIGSEFDLYGFGTLQKHFQTEDVVDLCGKCLKFAEVARTAAMDTASQEAQRAVRASLSK